MPERTRPQASTESSGVTAEAHALNIEAAALMKRLRVLKDLHRLLSALRARSMAQSVGLGNVNPGIVP